MLIQIDQVATEVPIDSSIDQVLAQLNIRTQGLALAVNQQVIPRTQWPNFRLSHQDRLDLFHIVVGG